MSVTITRDIRNILLMICRGGEDKIFFITERMASIPTKAASPELDEEMESDLR